MLVGKVGKQLAHVGMLGRACRGRRRAPCVSVPSGRSRSIALTGPIAAGDIEIERKPTPSSAMAGSGRPASLAAQRDRRAMRLARLARSAAAAAGTAPKAASNRSARRVLPRSAAVTNWNRSFEPTETKSTFAISSSSCQSSDGTSIIAPILKLVGRWWPKRARWRTSRSMMSRACVDFGKLGDHRQHDAQFAPARRLQQRADLGAQQARPVERQADRAPAERRVFLLARALEIGQHLVAADVDACGR